MMGAKLEKYIAQNRIVGLEPTRRAADGRLMEHVTPIGAEVLMDPEKAAPFVETGSLKPKRAAKEST